MKALVLVVMIAACESGGPGDASVDIDNGTCGPELRFTGEYIDWEADSGFCGIFNARFAVPGGGAMDTTAPNGRFDLCLSGAATTLLDITPPVGMSQCAQPPSSYDTPAIAVANPAVIRAGAMWSGRSFTLARRATLFGDAGLVFDPGKAQVLVHVVGPARAVTLSEAHAATQANAATTWAAGDTGHDVFFPNVDPAGGSALVSVAGGAIGAGTIPVVAGKMTNVTVMTR